MIDGAILIGSATSQAGARFCTVDPATGEALEPSFSSAGPDAVDQIATLAEASFPAHAATNPASRAAFIEACGALAIGNELIVRAMVHGGPFPATRDSRTTSVGTLAMMRFQRPVCFQNLPASLLPPAVAEGSAWGVARRIDGTCEASPA